MGNRNTMSESYIERKFVEVCKRHKMRVIKMSAMFETGIPDRLVLWKGYAGFCELKAPGKKPTLSQLSYHKKLKSEGNFIQIVDHPNKVVSWIEDFKKHVYEIENCIEVKEDEEIDYSRTIFGPLKDS